MECLGRLRCDAPHLASYQNVSKPDLCAAATKAAMLSRILLSCIVASWELDFVPRHVKSDNSIAWGRASLYCIFYGSKDGN